MRRTHRRAKRTRRCVGATDSFPDEYEDLAAEEGWIHLPSPGRPLSELAAH
jgi:hypothetical protein